MKKYLLLSIYMLIPIYISADSGCLKHSWGWGEKMPEHTQCYCNCERYTQVLNNRRKCIECGHYRVPKKMTVGKKHTYFEKTSKNIEELESAQQSTDDAQQ